MTNAISKITSNNNVNISQRIIDELGWSSEDEILEETKGEQVLLTNLTLNDWKNTELAIWNGELYHLLTKSSAKVAIITHENSERFGGMFAIRHPFTFISNFTKQFKGLYLDGFIDISEQTLEHYYPNKKFHNDARGNLEYKGFVKEMTRFKKRTTVTNMLVIDYNLLESIDSVVGQELKAALLEDNSNLKIILVGFLDTWKGIVKQWKIEDYLFLNTCTMEYFEVIEGKEQLQKKLMA